MQLNVQPQSPGNNNNNIAHVSPGVLRSHVLRNNMFSLLEMHHLKEKNRLLKAKTEIIADIHFQFFISGCKFCAHLVLQILFSAHCYNAIELLQLLRGIDIDLSQSSSATSSSEKINQKDVTTSRNTLSPPNISTLLDMSLSNLPTGSMYISKDLLYTIVTNLNGLNSILFNNIFSVSYESTIMMVLIS